MGENEPHLTVRMASVTVRTVWVRARLSQIRRGVPLWRVRWLLDRRLGTECPALRHEHGIYDSELRPTIGVHVRSHEVDTSSTSAEECAALKAELPASGEAPIVFARIATHS